MGGSKSSGLSDWKDGGAVTEKTRGRGLGGRTAQLEVPLDMQAEMLAAMQTRRALSEGTQSGVTRVWVELEAIMSLEKTCRREREEEAEKLSG